MVFEKVKHLLAEQLDLDENEITLDSLVVDDLGADALDLVDLAMTFEDEFSVEIPDTEIENIKTVGDIVKYLEENA